MAGRQNHFNISIRYSRSQQIVTYRGVGVYGRVNMSTLRQVLPPAGITGGTNPSVYWGAILEAVATALGQ